MYLEVKDLKKAYKIKKADPVMALDGVSLTFPENGLVFILGKSGSGKSTLLNVMGGLDTADSGEIIINGKSSKDFDGSELDSYRNTYLGFIFQEYNILSDFTVRDNIALALELQHKKADDDTINAILEEVGLTGFSKRKPNELSGGQKQRVAIARALVKEPKILFADEPTGALDSATGLAVFETLKKLSKTRLVVVVSHDRDFAERFGDRVIELKDGKVISDITKIEEDTGSLESGFSFYGTNLIKIEKGHKLTAKDIELLNEKLANSDTDAYFSIDTRINDSVNSAAMINERGKKESFVETANDEASKAHKDKEQWQVVKSKFPARSAFKMGAKSLRVKPFRLVLTIFISFVAFAMFGLAVSFARINRPAVTVNSIEKSGEKTISVGVNGNSGGQFGDAVKMKIEEKTGITFDPVVYFNAQVYTQKNVTNYRYYLTAITGATYIDMAQNRYGLSLFYGAYPTNVGEVAITLDMFNTYKEYGIRDSQNGTFIEADSVTKENVLGKHVSKWDYYSDTTEYFKIVGIVDTNLDMTKFDTLKTVNNNDYSQEINDLENELRMLRKSTLAATVFVSSEQMEKFSASDSVSFESNPWIGFSSMSEFGYEQYSTVGFTMKYDKTIFFDSTKTALGANEVLINFNSYARYLSDIMGERSEPEADEQNTFTFSNVFRQVNSAKQLVTPYVLETTMNNVLLSGSSYVNEIAGYLYAKECFMGAKKDPRIANWLYNQFSYDSSITDQLLVKDGAEYAQETLGGNTYYIVNWEGVENYYSTDNGIYGWIFDMLVNNFEEYNFPTAIDSCVQERNTAINKAETEIKNVVYKQYPNRYCDYILGQLNSFNWDNEDVEYFYSHYKTTALKDQFEEKTGDELTEDNKSNFIYWYLDVFCNNKPERDSIDATYYNDVYLSQRVQAIKDAMASGDIPTNDLDAPLKKTRWMGDTSGVEDLQKKIVGFYFGPSTKEFNFYMSKAEILAISPDACGAKYSMLITPMPNHAQLISLADLYYTSQDAYQDGNEVEYYDLCSPTVQAISMWVGLFDDLGMIFLYTGLGVAMFSMLLFYNFISISINNKRHEVGVLRAVGARGTDVFKIFYSESLIIGLINFTLAILSVFGVSIGLNFKIGEKIPGLVLLNTGIIEILAVFGLAMFASLISTLLPVVRLSKQKPIDAIREK